MGHTLKIYDVSYLVNVGSKSKYRSDTIMGMQCGGIIFLMEKVFLHLKEGHAVALAFDSRCDKKELFAEYKATRSRDMSIYVQNQILFDFCKRMGLPVFKRDGYEADELIFNIVQKNYKFFDHVDIYCHDADICCNILAPHIRCIGCANDPMINTENYPFEIFRDETIPYNAILPYIVCYGKKSNNIPRLRLECCSNPDDIFVDFLKYCKKQNISEAQRSSEKFILLWALTKTKALSASDSQALLRRIKMVYPRVMVGTRFELNFSSAAGLKKSEALRFMRIFNMRASAMNLNMSAELNSLRKSADDEGDKRLLVAYKNMLDSGNMLARDDLSVFD